MYFSNFPKIFYDFDLSNKTDYRVITDITKNVRFRKQILENVTLYDYYDMSEGETPEMVSEKVYGTPYYHWVIMIANERYDYVNDFPLSQQELDALIDQRYGDNKYQVHHYLKDGSITEGLNILTLRESNIVGGGIGDLAVGDILKNEITGYMGRIDEVITPSNETTIVVSVSIREGKFSQNETLTIPGIQTYVEVQNSVIPSIYSSVSNYDYEFYKNENKRRIKIISPDVIDQIIKEFKDIL